MRHVLFLCSQNRLRSPTAERVFSDRSGIEVESAGLDNDAQTTCTLELVGWADVIFVMEKSHRSRLTKRFRSHLGGARVVCLDIPDEYEFMQPELVRLLQVRVGRYLGTVASET